MVWCRTETGWLQPEVEYVPSLQVSPALSNCHGAFTNRYVYDLPIPRNADFKPRPNDGEVECFEVRPVFPSFPFRGQV